VCGTSLDSCRKKLKAAPVLALRGKLIFAACAGGVAGASYNKGLRLRHFCHSGRFMTGVASLRRQKSKKGGFHRP
jgi:hypothetical protein